MTVDPTVMTSRRWVLMVAVLLSAWHAFMAASVSRHFCTTFDEIAHVTAGYGYWTGGDFRLQPENGNLPQRLIALPLLAMDLPPLPPENIGWLNGNVWELGDAFFHGEDRDTAAILAAARTMIAVVSGGLCFLIFWWSRHLFGDYAGLVSVTLAAFSPTLLASGGLATSDTTTALMFCAAALAWWRVCHRVSLASVLTAGLMAGLLAVSKFSAILFAPMALIMAGGRLNRPAPLPVSVGQGSKSVSGLLRPLTLAGAGLLAVLIAWVTIWAFFGFRFHPSPDPTQTAYARPWSELMMETPPPMSLRVDGTPASTQPVSYAPGIVQTVAKFSLDHRVFPEAYLHGLLIVDRYSRSRLAFFNGEYRNTGWVLFFPTAFLLKTPLGALGLIAAGIWALFGGARRSERWYQLTPILSLIGVYLTVIMTSNLNIGHRHMLPLYPGLFVLAGGATWIAAQRNWFGAMIVLFLGWHVTASWTARPHYLAYFNGLAGGPEKAHQKFVDSSLDWGQDLPGLADWLNTHDHPEPVFLSYFGKGIPERWGIKATRVGDSYFDNGLRKVPADLAGGTFAISATMLQRVYTPASGPWTPRFEATYTMLRTWMAQMADRNPSDPLIGPDQQPISTDEFTALLWKFEDLQFARLCHYLKYREPDDTVGYSILLYFLSDEEVAVALHAPLSTLNAAIEKLLD